MLKMVHVREAQTMFLKLRPADGARATFLADVGLMVVAQGRFIVGGWGCGWMVMM